MSHGAANGTFSSQTNCPRDEFTENLLHFDPFPVEKPVVAESPNTWNIFPTSASADFNLDYFDPFSDNKNVNFGQKPANFGEVDLFEFKTKEEGEVEGDFKKDDLLSDTAGADSETTDKTTDEDDSLLTDKKCSSVAGIDLQMSQWSIGKYLKFDYLSRKLRKFTDKKGVYQSRKIKIQNYNLNATKDENENLSAYHDDPSTEGPPPEEAKSTSKVGSHSNYFGNADNAVAM